MLDVGFSEILLTSAIALIVLGPERLPKVARQVGNWMGRARAMARQLSEQLEREVSADELLKLNEKSQSIKGPSSSGSGTATPPALAAMPAFAVPLAPDSSPAPATHYGADAASTTAEAMHASDPPATDSRALATGTQPSHE